MEQQMKHPAVGSGCGQPIGVRFVPDQGLDGPSGFGAPGGRRASQLRPCGIDLPGAGCRLLGSRRILPFT